MKSTAAFLILISMSFHSLRANTAGSDSTEHHSFLPSIAHAQFAGFIGMFCAGAGYHYAHNKLSASLLYGYVPKEYATNPIHTLALKNSANIIHLRSMNTLQPILYGGFSINCELSKHAFITLPDYYPTGYYSRQAIHATLFIGTRLYIPLHPQKEKSCAIEPFAEIGSLDTYLWYYISHESVDADDIFRAALGLNFIFR